MLRTHTCGELRLADVGKKVILAGWVQNVRDKGALLWIDLRDRYGITQLLIDENHSKQLFEVARQLGREYVIQAEGMVIERVAKNDKLPTGEIEVRLSALHVLNASKTPPFLISDETDGGDELRMKYRYLDIRRNPVRQKLELRHRMAQEVRKYLSDLNFIEVETPVLIKSTPEGARDFVVPSRLNPGEFYALPQSPQTFKQILMVAGIDRYFQIVKCFRDEDLRTDRQPEFTQIDCEMSFVTQEDILNTFEGLIKHLFRTLKGIELPTFRRMDYAEAIKDYGSDKPDLRFGMKFNYLDDLAKGRGFSPFDEAETIIAINAEGCASYTRRQIDELTEWVRRPQIGAKIMVYVKYETNGSLKSSVDRFYTQEHFKKWVERCNAKPGDMLLILSGNLHATRKAMNELRLEMGNRLGLRNKNHFEAFWVVNFPLLEKDEQTGRWNAMHHPFTSPLPEDLPKLATAPGEVRANAYDMVINGVEVGGGSIRIHDRKIQEQMFETIGLSKEEARQQFGFLMDAFEFGAPPHGGIAFGFDRLCAVLSGVESIRDFIAFPKNTSGRDVMIDSPSPISEKQLEELFIKVVNKDNKK